MRKSAGKAAFPSKRLSGSSADTTVYHFVVALLSFYCPFIYRRTIDHSKSIDRHGLFDYVIDFC